MNLAASGTPDPIPMEVATAETSSGPGLESLSEMLAAIRRELHMDVAFVSRFANGRRIFEHVDALVPCGPVQEGASDPLETTYCQRVVDGRAPLVIPDTAREPSVKDLPITESLGIRSYLSAPIVLRDGSVYGTLCCLSHRAEPSLSQRDADALRAIADMVAAGVSKRGQLRSHLWLGS